MIDDDWVPQPAQDKERETVHQGSPGRRGDGTAPDFRPGPPDVAARWMSVVGVCAGAGTTTIAALLSLGFATHRRYRIVAVDVHGAAETGAALGTRLGTQVGARLGDVADASASLTSFAMVSSYLARSPHGAWVVAGSSSLPTDTGVCRQAITALSCHFAVGILDCGTVMQPAAEALLAHAQAPLLVVPVTSEGVLMAARTLDWLSARGAHPHSWHAGVALVSGSRSPRNDVGWATRLLTKRGGRVVPVPFDPGLVSRCINPTSVSDGAWAAVRRLGTEMLSRAAASSRVDWENTL